MKRRKTLSLGDLLTKQALRDVAGPAIYSRGESYFRSGLAHQLRHLNGRLSAKVSGASFDDYEVHLWSDDNHLRYLCTCPMGEEGGFCKHVVATGLLWLNGVDSKESAKPQKVKSRPKRLPDDRELLLSYLLKQSAEELAELLLVQCAHNAELHLALQTAARTSQLKPLGKAATTRKVTASSRKRPTPDRS